MRKSNDLIESADACYLLVKRGLYYRPNRQGYTAIKAEAGRYTRTDGEVLANSGVSFVHVNEADEYSPSCLPETKVRHMEATIASLSEALAEAEKKGAEDASQAASYYAAISQCLERYQDLASRYGMHRLSDFIVEAQDAVDDKAPLNKLNRWLGYIQGTLIASKATTVEAERDWTRPLFRPLDFPLPRDLSQGDQP